MLIEADVREALRVCFDPELPVNIVDLGLVQRIQLTADADAPGAETRFRVQVQLLRRTHDEQREAMLLGQVTNRLAGMYAISASEVVVTDEPGWTAEKITDAGRAALGLSRPARPGLIQIDLS